MGITFMTRSITIEDLYRMVILSRPRISPDGQRVAFVATTIDGSKHEYRSAIWIVPTESGEARQFTASAANAHSPSWSPDGRWLAFVSAREGEITGKASSDQNRRGKGKPQIWLIPTDGGEAHQLTFMEHGASSPSWSPDSKHILFSATIGPADEESEEGRAMPKVRVIDRLWYRLDSVGFIHERRSHLFLVDVASGKLEQITDGDWDDDNAAWSPDGTHIAFTSNRAEDRWRRPGPDLNVLTIKDGKAGALRCLTDGTLWCSSPCWSPDSKTIAFLASYKVRSADHTYLYSLSASAEREAASCLSQEFEGSCMDFTNSDISEYLMPAPVWSADGETLYVLAAHRGATRLFAIPKTGADKQPATLTPGDVHVQDFTFDHSRNKVALLIGDPIRPQEIFVRSTSPSSELHRITNFNDTLFDELTLSTPEYMPYTGEDGWPIDGWVLKPHNFDPSKKYPLVVQIHGGPQTQYGYGFFHEMQMLAAHGYVILYTNPRGSCGYGYEFALAVHGAWGEKDSVDIMKGVETLLLRGYIDEQRMGVMGGSYGGFMTNWLISHDDRFKAAVSDRGITNLASLFGTSDLGWTLGYDNLGIAPWEDLEKYMRMSPIKYVQNIHTPLLIIHSEQDLRCSIEQAEQLFAALKWIGREVLFVRFEGQSHRLSRYGHPKLRLQRLKHIKDWFEKHLK